MKAIERIGELLRVELYPNGKARTPLLVWEKDASEPLMPLDAVSLDAASDRQKFVERLPVEAQTEAARLLEACAVELLRIKADGKTAEETATPTATDPEPNPDPVDGAEVLDAITTLVTKHVYLPSEHVADAIALWVTATWFVTDCFFAPLLAVISATKRCGKTTLLDIITHLVRRGFFTSGVGITPAVLFRVNERDHPTFLIDEVEKLGGRDPDKEIIGLVNSGHRRGSVVLRMVERGGEFDVQSFDAFGFRALAAVGSLWDTVMDRAITVRLARKPCTVKVARFEERRVAPYCQALASKITRWVQDNQSVVVELEASAPRPEWLNDRECDSWAILFAVAGAIGGDWPERAHRAARTLRADTDDDTDLGERLIRDIRRVFEAAGRPDAIASGDLITRLNEIETSPWGDFRKDKGMSTRQLSARLRPFEIVPSQHRNAAGEKVRGYWLNDFRVVFQRYPPPEHSDVGQVGQSNESAGFEAFEVGQPASLVPHEVGQSHMVVPHKDAETPAKTGNVPVVPVETPEKRGAGGSLVNQAIEYMRGNPRCPRRDVIDHLGMAVSRADREAAVDAAEAALSTKEVA